VTRNRRSDRFTVEKLGHDCFDVRFLRRKGFFDDGGVKIFGHFERSRRDHLLLDPDARRHGALVFKGNGSGIL
jgi:hypothetical protein